MWEKDRGQWKEDRDSGKRIGAVGRGQGQWEVGRRSEGEWKGKVKGR